MFGYLLATLILSWCRRSSPAEAGPHTHIRHLPKLRSSTSKALRPSSSIVSSPVTPISATPYSTYVGTSGPFARKNLTFCSSFTNISLRLFLSSISLHSIPAFSRSSMVFSASLPFVSANVRYLSSFNVSTSVVVI